MSSEDMNIVEDGLPPTEGADEVQEDKDEANLDTVDETFTNLDTVRLLMLVLDLHRGLD